MKQQQKLGHNVIFGRGGGQRHLGVVHFPFKALQLHKEGIFCSRPRIKSQLNACSGKLSVPLVNFLLSSPDSEQARSLHAQHSHGIVLELSRSDNATRVHVVFGSVDNLCLIPQSSATNGPVFCPIPDTANMDTVMLPLDMHCFRQLFCSARTVFYKPWRYIFAFLFDSCNSCNNKNFCCSGEMVCFVICSLVNGQRGKY